MRGFCKVVKRVRFNKFYYVPVKPTGAVPTSEPCLWKPQEWFQHQNRVCGNHRSGSNSILHQINSTQFCN